MCFIIKHCWICSVNIKLKRLFSLQTQHISLNGTFAYYDSEGISVFSSAAGVLNCRDQNESDVLRSYNVFIVYVGEESKLEIKIQSLRDEFMEDPCSAWCQIIYLLQAVC